MNKSLLVLFAVAVLFPTTRAFAECVNDYRGRAQCNVIGMRSGYDGAKAYQDAVRNGNISSDGTSSNGRASQDNPQVTAVDKVRVCQGENDTMVNAISATEKSIQEFSRGIEEERSLVKAAVANRTIAVLCKCNLSPTFKHNNEPVSKLDRLLSRKVTPKPYDVTFNVDVTTITSMRKAEESTKSSFVVKSDITRKEFREICKAQIRSLKIPCADEI